MGPTAPCMHLRCCTPRGCMMEVPCRRAGSGELRSPFPPPSSQVHQGQEVRWHLRPGELAQRDLPRMAAASVPPSAPAV